ncbi:MAG TPA: site-specific integrase [Desulfotignum sp.]|nr:site-specific integrase [Desulfotignum sp.]
MESLTMLEWASKYLDFANNNFSIKTYKEKLSAFQRLGDFFGDVKVDSITPSKAMEFLGREHENRSGNAANKDRKNLVAAWNWASRYMDGFPSGIDNPFASVPKFREERQARYIPPKEDFDKVYAIAEGQDKVMLAVFLYLASRIKEVFNLRWSDVDFENNKVRLWTQKRRGGTREADWLPMIPELASSLKNWKAECPVKSDHVFICLDSTVFTEPYYGRPFTVRQHFMKKLCAKAGVIHFGFHAIRHLTASKLYHKGFPVSAIQALLRHKSPSTTNVYLKSIGAEFIRGSLEDVFSE